MEVINSRVKQLEQELAAVKEELQQQKYILSLTPGHIYWKDTNGVILGCNLEQAKILGCDTEEQVIGTTDENYFSKEEAEILRANDEKVMRTGKPLIKEEEFSFPNRDKQVFLSKRMPLYSNNDKSIVGIIAVSMDISGQKQAEKYKIQQQKIKKIKELKNFYENIVSKMPGHVYWLDTHNVYLGCNDEQAADAGLANRKEIIGKTNKDMIWKEYAEQLDTINLSVMQTGKSLTVEEDCLFTGGKGIWFSKKVPLYNNANKVTGLLGISFNISDWKKAEQLAIGNARMEKEKELKQFYEYIISKLPGHVYWTDKNGIYLGCNNKQAHSLGMDSPQEIKGKRTTDLLPPHQAEKIDKINKEVIETGETYTVEEECLFTKKSPQFMYSKKVPLYDKDNQINGILGMSIDISDRKEAERLAVENARIEKEKEEAQKYAEHMRTLASNISHEHKTPLAGIKVTLQIIQQLFPKLITGYKAAVDENLIDEPLASEQIDSIINLFNKSLLQIDRATTMVSIQLYNMQHNKFQTKHFKESSIANVIDEALSHYPFTDSEKTVVHKNLSANFLFYGDPLLLQHVIWNLLKNALHFIKEEDKGEIAIWLENDTEFNKLHFKDTAKGISPEEKTLIFQAFYSQRTGGSGLGLAFCHSVIEAFGGTIQCYSKPGEYTEFVLTFPNRKQG